MGFTKSTTNTTVHQNMPDYPSSEGYTAEQLKQAFDAPATGLKADINRLIDELENVNASTKMGANAMYDGDSSDSNIQAKLVHLYETVSAAILGQIPDNSITKNKLVSSYESTIAKKDNTLQTNLNADKVDGYNFLDIMSAVNSRVSQNDSTFSTTESSSRLTYNFTMQAKSRFILFTIDGNADPFAGLFDCKNNIFLFYIQQLSEYARLKVNFVCNGEAGHYIDLNTSTATNHLRNVNYSSGILSIEFRSNATTTIKCTNLDGLMP